MRWVLRALLALVGAAIIFLGLNVGFGGIETLGWQGSGAFIEITDPSLYAVRDNHVRFIGGVWLGAGLVFVLSAFLLDRMRDVLLALVGMIVIGVLARLSALEPSLLMSPEIAPSLVAELFGFPLLALWIWRSAPDA